MSDQKNSPERAKYQIDVQSQNQGMPAGLGTVLDLLHAAHNSAPAIGNDATAPQPALTRGNLYANSAAPAEGERFEALHQQAGLLIERIVSSPRIAHEEYCQPHAEWVLLVQGCAVLEVAGESISLQQGDYLYIPAQTRHTVRSVSDGAIWLAIHLGIAPKAL
jgi:cupin 2 domain-containing protein